MQRIGIFLLLAVFVVSVIVLLRWLESWRHKQQVSHPCSTPDLPYSAVKLIYQDRAYRAEATPSCISIRRLPDGDGMDFSTDLDAPHAKAARNAFNGDDWGLASLQELFELYEAAQTDKTGRGKHI